MRPGFPLTPALLLLVALGGCDGSAARLEPASAGANPKIAAATPPLPPVKVEPVVSQLNPGDASQLAAAAPIQRDDALIAAKVMTGLAADKNTTALRIKVDSRGGVVTLRGPAPSAAARARAEEIARNVQGVTSVDNQLEVRAG